MGVYILGYEMPERCTMCRMCGAQFCILTANRILDFTKRNEDCPLIEVKAPHGRLIDAEDLLFEAYCTAPTVIEAEGKDDG